MVGPDSGIYVSFYNADDPPERELPALGPFELLIVRHNRLLGDREDIEHDALALGSVERWLEAELELRRAFGDEPGGPNHDHLRIRAPRSDIIVRFYDYAGDEPPTVPELGPFYVLTIGKREVRADEKVLAIRYTDMSPWTLTDAVHPGSAGINKADFSVFALSARDPSAVLPAVTPASPSTAAPIPAPEPVTAGPTMAAASVPPVTTAASVADLAPAKEPSGMTFTERRKVLREIYVARPNPMADERLTPADVNLILRVDRLKQQELAQQLMVERLRRAQHVDPEAALGEVAVATTHAMRFEPPVRERERAAATPEEDDGAEPDEARSFGERVVGLLWSARLLLISLLVLVAIAGAVGYVRGSATTSSGPRPITFAGANERIQTPDWTYVVDSVERAVTLGPTRAQQGGYLVVHLTAIRKNGDAAALDPSDFVLVDSAGGQSLAFGTTSDLYSAQTTLTWPQRFPIGGPARGQIVFDVSPSAKDLLLLIRRASVEVRLPN